MTYLNDSFHMFKFKAREQTFYDIADDILNRYVTATAILDYHTMIGADKFQNIFISRVPPSTPFLTQTRRKTSRTTPTRTSSGGRTGT